MRDDETIIRYCIQINNKLTKLQKKANTMSQELDHLTASVAELKGVAQSAEALLAGLSAQLKACLAMDDSAASLAAIQQLADDIDADKAELAKAVADNTPPAPAPASNTAPIV